MFQFRCTFFQLVLPVLILSEFCFSTANGLEISKRNLVEASCPLNFSALREFLKGGPLKLAFMDVPNQCQYIPEGIRFVRSEYLRTNGYFVPPPATFQTCWDSYRDLIREITNGLDIQSGCGYQAEWISMGCGNITSVAEIESQIPESGLQEMRLSCNQSLDDDLVCTSCTEKLLSIGRQYLRDRQPENVSDCSGYLRMYAAAIVNQLGPTDPGTAKCLFRLKATSKPTTSKRNEAVTSGIIAGCVIGVLGGSVAVCWILRRRSAEEKIGPAVGDASLDIGLGLRSSTTNLVKFKIDEIRKATMNFSRHNIIGRGGFGNVYKGMLPDGSEVAFKRFKNCSASGDETFAHEVEIIAGVRHVNLVALRGYCTATVPMEGYQRIIVCDLMHNGSLHDHLFGSGKKKLSWPIREKIALGTARGLAYLHYGVHPAIIHRDIKGNNILLDDNFEPKVADFGLARYYAQGMTHLSTRVAGSLGYVAPEYALYGRLTERSDVYSFGIVLLELLSGKKAYENNEGKTHLLAEWAWLLAQEGRALDIIEGDLPESGLPEVMEQYVHTALICAHPILDARPTMDQIVNILERTSSNPDQVRSINSSFVFSSSVRSNEMKLNSENRDMQGSFTKIPPIV